MPFKKTRTYGLLLALLSAATMPVVAQTDVKAIVLKHLKTSRDFTLKVAEQMPEATYDFKLTPPQMSFAEQMVHLSQALSVFISPFSAEEPKPNTTPLLQKKEEK